MAITNEELREILRDACNKTEGGQAAWAKANNMSAAYVSDVLRGNREPAEKIAAVFQMERTGAPWIKKKPTKKK